MCGFHRVRAAEGGGDGLGGRGGGGFGGLAALTVRATTARGTHQPRRRLRPRKRKAIAAARPSSPSRASGCSTRAFGGGAAFAARQESRELFLCHCASRKGAEYVTCCAAVRRECLRRRQFAFIGPPAPVQFYKLPDLFHLRLSVPTLCERRHRGLACRLVPVSRRAVLMLAVG